MTTARDGLPATIPFSKIEDVLAAIGLDAHDCISLTFDIDRVVIVTARTITDGRAIAAGNGIATTTTEIGYDRDA